MTTTVPELLAELSARANTARIFAARRADDAAVLEDMATRHHTPERRRSADQAAAAAAAAARHADALALALTITHDITEEMTR